MNQNLVNLAMRDDKLSSLYEKSDEMAHTSYVIQKKATTIKRKVRCKGWVMKGGMAFIG